jgi:hypothetical protein
MAAYREEIFGPVLVCLEVGSACLLFVRYARRSCSPDSTEVAYALRDAVQSAPSFHPPGLQAPDLDSAISLVNGNEHGNGAAVFTHSGAAARKFQNEVWCSD